MKVQWIGVSAVILIAVALVALKPRAPAFAPTHGQGSTPQVVLVADLSEAGSDDGCGRLIEAVRAAHKRGVRAVELPPQSTSPLVAQYKVLIAPTVLFLAPDGTVRARYEGESSQVVAAVERRLEEVSTSE